MESHEVLKKAVEGVGVKGVASGMSLSTSLVYKWCESRGGPDSAGAGNPLDRVEKICRLTGDIGPIAWLCQRADGFFVANPSRTGAKDRVLAVTQRILREFSELLDVVSQSIQDDNLIDEKEADRIRQEWEDLKSVGESFVKACEEGAYGGSSARARSSG